MCNEKDKKMMLKFLERNYPISKVKFEMRFRRGIILNGAVYVLSNMSSKKQLILELKEILKLVFSCDEQSIIYVLSSFLKIN